MYLIAFLVAGVLFLLYPVTRPWHDETTAAGARESMASSAWVAAHFFAMLGFIASGTSRTRSITSRPSARKPIRWATAIISPVN